MFSVLDSAPARWYCSTASHDYQFWHLPTGATAYTDSPFPIWLLCTPAGALADCPPPPPQNGSHPFWFSPMGAIVQPSGTHSRLGSCETKLVPWPTLACHTHTLWLHEHLWVLSALPNLAHSQLKPRCMPMGAIALPSLAHSQPWLSCLPMEAATPAVLPGVPLSGPFPAPGPKHVSHASM